MINQISHLADLLLSPNVKLTKLFSDLYTEKTDAEKVIKIVENTKITFISLLMLHT